MSAVTVRQRDCRMFGRPVQTWLARIAPPRGLAGPAGLRLLSEDELARMDRLVSGQVRQEFAAGRALARLALGRWLAMPPRQVRLAVDAESRPMLAGPRGLAAIDFNLSHSGDLVTVAVAGGLRLGIDVELRTDRASAPALARRFFSPAENAILERSGPADYSLRWHRIWTTREAHAKARGIGVRAIGAPLAGHGRSWQRAGVPVPAGYAGSLVALAPGSSIALAPGRAAGDRTTRPYGNPLREGDH